MDATRDRGDRGGRDRDRGPRGTGPGGFKGGRDRGLPKPQIQEIFKRGQEVIVQVIKEGIGTKGPTLSTYISIAGPLPRADAEPEPRRRLAQDRGRRRPPPAPRDHDDAQPAEGRRLHRPHRRDRPRREGTPQRPRVPAPALAGRRAADQASLRAGRDLPRIGHDHADHPRHLHERHRHDLGRRGERLRARQRVPADRDAAVRQPHPLLREHRTAVPQVRHRGRDRRRSTRSGSRCRSAARSSSSRPKRSSPST